MKVLWKGRFKFIFWTKEFLGMVRKRVSGYDFFFIVYSLFESKPARFTAPWTSVQPKSSLKDFMEGVQ